MPKTVYTIWLDKRNHVGVYLADGIDGTGFTGRRQNCGGINIRFLRSAVLLRPILSPLFNEMLAYRIIAEVLVILVGLLIKGTQE